ncbi:MAG TPA: S41 family peptidase, partial [Roseiflexaceae bacterium]|mgnify:CR=1 FL=1|nr:S41 family peptidase [Roseiflexaceae bacterium]
MTARTSYLLTRSLFVGVLLVIGFVGGWLSARLLGDRVAAAIAPIFGPQAMAPRDTPAALREPFGVFWEAWSIVEHDFYGRGMLDPQRMIRGAISGMLASLDDTYTVYQEPELAAQTNEHMQGRQGGIGTYLRITAGRAFLYKPIRGGPAVAAGLQQDDELLQIDGRDVAALIAGLDVNEAAVRIASHLRGSVGTPVVLQVRRAADGAVVELELTRADVKIPSVEAQLMAGSIGYIRIS